MSAVVNIDVEYKPFISDTVHFTMLLKQTRDGQYPYPKVQSTFYPSNFAMPIPHHQKKRKKTLRPPRIELGPRAWEARILPLNYERGRILILQLELQAMN